MLFALRIPAAAGAVYGPRGLRFLLNVATALLVVSLPIAASTATTATIAPEFPTVAAVPSVATEDGSSLRVQSAARGVTAASRSVVTVAAEDVRPVVQYQIADGDNLGSIAKQYQVELDDLAYANGIDDEGARLHIGNTLLIPPGRGALYFVKDGDTVASVAAKFKVDATAIMSYNRLYFEPEHFATDQLIFVPGAEVPAMKRTEIAKTYTPSNGQLPARTGRLGWPVNGVITQYFWWGHTGVDIAAPYGTTIVASDDGVVSATGWVAVGGLRVCVDHSGGLQTCYYHTGAVFVTPGQTVARGQPLASIGMTGVTTGPHVHWEVKLNGVAVNGLAY
ncbi:MAG TPA: peptidoglycan DD-metalloendopeptidase family protein [Candidatus Limnocylindria bacterium]|nr:peptidoglycan DD-metalloendopeptidase family protein [Candidatus Limnocylindria bacterium]